MNGESNCSSAFKCGLIGFILGAAAGAAAALFLTTKTGEELRTELKAVIVDIQKTVKEKSSKIKDITSEKYEEIVKSTINAYNKARKFTEKEIELIKTVLLEKMDEVKEEK